MTGPAIGTTVVDEGVAGPERFKRAVYWAGEGRKRGLYLQTSSDGKDWNFTTSNPILPRTDDIVDLWKDPRTGTYGLFIKHMVNDKRDDAEPQLRFREVVKACDGIPIRFS